MFRARLNLASSIALPAASPSKSNPASDVDSAPHAAFALDASTIDVYRNTDGVILLYDISKPWTFDYAAKALADVPTNIPVLLLVCRYEACTMTSGVLFSRECTCH